MKFFSETEIGGWRSVVKYQRLAAGDRKPKLKSSVFAFF
jgi:hypothetical protein